MNEHDIAEQAYKNGYEKGYEDGKRDAVKHGYFTFYSSHGEDEYEWECSNCHDWADMKYTYCPCCGARMDGDGNG